MPMTKHLSRHGNSLALVIDRAILDLLDMDETTPLTITTDGRSLIIVPAGGANRKREFEKAVERSLKKFGPMYRRLAER